MSSSNGWLDRLLSWAVGAPGGDRPERARPDDTAFLIPARADALDEGEHRDRSEREREIELRVLMSTWMKRRRLGQAKAPTQHLDQLANCVGSSLRLTQPTSSLRPRIGAIDTKLCPLYLLTGEYDFSCSPADTQRTAASIAGAEVVVMQECGHFPMSENPAQFRRYILPVLEKIRGAR